MEIAFNWPRKLSNEDNSLFLYKRFETKTRGLFGFALERAMPFCIHIHVYIAFLPCMCVGTKRTYSFPFRE